MSVDRNIILKPAKGKPGNPLAGAANVAIEKAERYKTPLVVKTEKGEIREITPAQMKRIILARSGAV